MNGRAGDGEPPPSTFAAQIVDNLERTQRQNSLSSSTAHLSELLNAILVADRQNLSSEEAFDNNLGVNQKLICVIVQARLLKLSSNNPFDDNDKLHRQACGCLAVIELLIRRFPDLLYLHPEPQDTTRPDGPLFLWLLPHIINLINYRNHEDIQTGAKEVLTAIVHSHAQSPTVKGLPQPTLQYVRGCVKDLLFYLEKSSDESNGQLESYHIPTAETLSDAFPQLANVTPEFPRVIHDDISRDYFLIVQLLSILSLRKPKWSPRSANRAATRLNDGLGIDCLAGLLPSTSSAGGMASMDGLTHSYPQILQLLRLYISHLYTLRFEAATCARAVILLCRYVVWFINFLSDDQHQTLGNVVSWAIVDLFSFGRKAPAIIQLYQEHLQPVLQAAVENKPEIFTGDLQKIIVYFLGVYSTDSTLLNTAPPTLDDIDLGEFLLQVLPSNGDGPNNLPHSRKRLRYSDADAPPTDDPRTILGKRIFKIIKLTFDPDSDALKLALETFRILSEEEQCLVMTAVGETACLDAETMCHGGRCSFCDSSCRKTPPRSPMNEALSDDLFQFWNNLLKTFQEQKLPRTRVTAMVCLNRLLGHIGNTDQLDLSKSVLKQWCLQSLKSSVRDLRIASVKALKHFVWDALDASFLVQNRLLVLEAVRSLADKGDLTLQETCVMAFGQLASCISSEEELNVILQRLVEFLGHTNGYISNLVFEELQNLSSHSPLMALRLFEPYWKTIAVLVVQNLNKRPQIAQLLGDLLGMGIPGVLKLTQLYTIPYLVLTKRRDVLQRIADAHGPGTTTADLCVQQPEQMPAILSILILHAMPDSEDIIMTLLHDAFPDLVDDSLGDILKSDPVHIVCELLKVAGEDDKTRKVRAREGINFLASRIHRRSSHAKDSLKIHIGLLFVTFALGIIQTLSDVIAQVNVPRSISERRRCIRAVEQMALIAEGHLSNALPQISSCLRSALEDPVVCNEAFSTWITLMTTLDEVEIEGLIDPTFAIIAQHWESFNSEIQSRASSMVTKIMKTQPEMIREMVNTIPSLASIPVLSKAEGELSRLKATMDPKHRFLAYAQRCQKENATVVGRALLELSEYLSLNQSFLHTSALSEQPDPVIPQLVRSLLDACALFNETDPDIVIRSAQCLGMIGCLDPTKIEITVEVKEIFVLYNFRIAEEIREFVVFFIQEVLLKAFLATTDTRLQGILGFAIQELLHICGFTPANTLRRDYQQPDALYKRWIAIPESIRNTLNPFITSKYSLGPPPPLQPVKYPLYNPGISHTNWLRWFVLDLLAHCRGENATLIFRVSERIIRKQDITIPTFLLPFVALNIVVDGTREQREDIAKELLAILERPLPKDQLERENLILCSQNVFRVIDYFSRWIKEKNKALTQTKNTTSRKGVDISRGDLQADHSSVDQISIVEAVLNKIPAEIISSRAVACKSYARALFYWEQYIRQRKDSAIQNSEQLDTEPLYQKLQDIYTQIDEPDGIEGISAHLQVLSMDQQVIEHHKAGRWTAVQSWYELLLNEQPGNIDIQVNLLNSLRESGQYDTLLTQAANFSLSEASILTSRPFAVEAAWVTGKWDKLESQLEGVSTEGGIFNVGIGLALLSLRRKDYDGFSQVVDRLQRDAARRLSSSSTSSLQSCHDVLLRLHVLYEIETLSGAVATKTLDRQATTAMLDRRLGILGAFSSDKQYILGVRRAAMALSRHEFSGPDFSSAWLTSARLARKANFSHPAFDAVIRASQLSDIAAPVENAKLLWKEGYHRKAMQSLESVITGNAFQSRNAPAPEESFATNTTAGRQRQQANPVGAKAHLQLAKWLDQTGQTQSEVIVQRYRKVTFLWNRWEGGHYHLGKHYNKLLESEKAKDHPKQAQTFITGETAKLVIENYLRSLGYGAKYIYQTLPRVLTLWLELGSDVEKPCDTRYGSDFSFRQHIDGQRKKLFAAVMAQVKKYIDRLPPFIFYTALAQIVARVCHTNPTVYSSLVDIISKVVFAHPQQALWTLMALTKSKSQTERANRGTMCVTKVIEMAAKSGSDAAKTEMRTLINNGERLSDQLLQVCDRDVAGKHGVMSLSKDFKFNHQRATSCRLVIPMEKTLLATLPTGIDTVRGHKGFSKDTVTISKFLDDTTIMNSLIRPRRVSILGSDGKIYSIMCKPKDDLRKDQRLLDFNSMISRILKKDAECSKRRLYIKTYAVTPLNETCGLIEWVEGMRTLRDILLELYQARGITPQYKRLAELQKQAGENPSKASIFTNDLLSQFPPVFHQWFVEAFPEPTAWFEARLRYTRSCAAMSMIGHVLGLGDRHGENILFEEAQGGTLHVDFNCLFDKGKTFEYPERVPFRLTHNMVDAFGSYGYDGPFRKSCELTLGILRQHEDTLMTILETFLYDPTTDFIGQKKRAANNIPVTPEGVLESIRSKVRGVLPMESVPLSVEGCVDYLIKQATDPYNLTRMYIGWCSFL